MDEGPDPQHKGPSMQRVHATLSVRLWLPHLEVSGAAQRKRPITQHMHNTFFLYMEMLQGRRG